jgi:hypothetical protein
MAEPQCFASLHHSNTPVTIANTDRYHLADLKNLHYLNIMKGGKTSYANKA